MERQAVVVPSFPTFAAFYAAVNKGRAPFPWQSRLAERVSVDGWPSSIGIPTGMGKTACIDIAIWELARQAATRSARERTAPTRTWYVVNRRLLVDVAAARARDLSRLLVEPELAPEDGRSIVRAVAEALRGAGAGVGRDVLHVTHLRGGADLGHRPLEPSQPSLILATVPMFASRLLFRGYGASTAMRPIDAAMAGVDSLVLFDEAHLARPLAELVGVSARCDLGDASVLLPDRRSRCRLVELTATGREAEDRFDLDERDRAHPVIQRRLTAAKPVELVTTIAARLATELAKQARALLVNRRGSTCVVFCNTVGVARATARALADGDETVLLVTGRTREREAERARRTLLDPHVGAPAGRDSARSASTDLIVVATQTLEVGADLDFDYLVSETAGVRALTQRFGRLNRLGERPHARAVLCHPADAKSHRPYGTEPSDVWQRLTGINGAIDLTTDTIARVLGPPADVPPRACELLPDHLWELAKTSFPEPDEPPVELFFEGRESDPDVSVVWRARLPADEATKLLPTVREDEAVDVPVWEFREALRGREHVHRLAENRATIESVDVGRLRPGDVVVLSVDDGLYGQDGWDPDSGDVVLDVALIARGILWLDLASIRKLLSAGARPEIAEILQQLDGEEELDRAEEAELVGLLLDELAAADPHPWIGPDEWRGYLDRLRGDTRVHRDAGAVPYLHAPRRRFDPVEVRAEVFDELSFEGKAAGLAEHQAGVATLVAQIARTIGLPDRVVTSLVWSAEHHDVGKRDPRFQRWLDPDGAASGVLAKSDYPLGQSERWRAAAGWPRGGRHELLSARLLERWLIDGAATEVDAELAVHLVASHHGHGRPFIGTVLDRTATSVAVEIAGQRTMASGDLSLPDWRQPRRFRSQCERYGVWGLALLEAVLRQADQLASSAQPVTVA